MLPTSLPRALFFKGNTENVSPNPKAKNIIEQAHIHVEKEGAQVIRAYPFLQDKAGGGHSTAAAQL